MPDQVGGGTRCSGGGKDCRNRLLKMVCLKRLLQHYYPFEAIANAACSIACSKDERDLALAKNVCDRK